MEGPEPFGKHTCSGGNNFWKDFNPCKVKRASFNKRRQEVVKQNYYLLSPI